MAAEFKFELDDHVTTVKELSAAISLRRHPQIFNVYERTQTASGNKYKLAQVGTNSYVVEIAEANVIPAKSIRKHLIEELTSMITFYAGVEYK